MILGYTSILINDTEASLPGAASAGTIAYAMDIEKYFTYDGTTWRMVVDIDQLDSAMDGLDTALDGKQDQIAMGTISQYYRGDKTWQTFPSIPTVPAYAQSQVTRTLNSSFQPSTTRNTLGQYSVDIAATLSLVSGQTGTVFLEISPDGTTWTELSRFSNGNTGTLTLGLNLTQTVTGILTGTIPANYNARLRTTGTATVTYRSGQETAIL